MTFLEKQIRIKSKTFETDNIDEIKKLIGINLVEIKRITPYKEGKFRVTYSCYKVNALSYNELVNGLVREKYSDSEEFAILRKSINNPLNEEFVEYNNYVEQCKVKAKDFIEKRNLLLNNL